MSGRLKLALEIDVLQWKYIQTNIKIFQAFSMRFCTSVWQPLWSLTIGHHCSHLYQLKLAQRTQIELETLVS